MILRHAFIPPDNRRLAHVCGSLDQNLRTIEAALEVSIQRRHESFRVDGPKRGAERAVALLQQLYDQASVPIEPARLQLELIQVMQAPAAAPSASPATLSPLPPLPPTTAMPERLDGLDVIGAVERPADEIVLRTRRSDLVGRTANQVEYLRHILGHDITFGIGPAGTGKTFLAVACAVDALERNQVQRIVLTRPAVEAGERLGFLPGDLAQKVDPYLRPLYDALYDLMGLERVGKAFEKGLIEIAPLAFMRGRTLNHAFVILDEAQNTTPEQMKMFLTRIGFGSRAVVTGDISQIDLPKGSKSGLVDAAQVLRRVRGIAHTRFTSADVVRHPLVARIVEAYDAVPDSARRQAEAEAEAALDAAAARSSRPGARDGR
ncbi:PhoH family protein [Leptothrix discophora]|uniref:PhoH-like protein n=1 Tax=Leptothrix discophora TaxID=89 RepID=A0ABT9G5A6_LEPDI|nr:PhoH family protein [Leptothrix discophora]MDP4301671.1 PhoH family protein [Leptothrix discophora]